MSRRAAALALALAAAASSARAAAVIGGPSFSKELGTVRLTSATIQAAVGAFPTQRVYYIRGSSQVFSATTADGVAFTEDSGVRLSSLTAPTLDISISSITGLSVLPLSGSGFRMLYSVLGTTVPFRVYSATSADGLAWANDTGTAVNVAGGATFAGFPSLVKLASGDWRLYYVQNSIAGNQAANHQIFTALSTNQGRNWSAGSTALAVQAGEVSATKLTNNKVRLYYSAPLTGGTSNVLVLSAISADANGASFTSEAGVRLSTSPGFLSSPFVAATTDTFRWRMYFDYAPPGVSTGDAYSATADAPAPAAITPSRVLNIGTPGNFTVTGDVFSPGVTAVLRMAGQADIVGAGLTRADDQTFTALFDTNGKTPGVWDLVVTDANGQSGTLSQAELVDFPGGGVAIVDNLLRPRTGAKTSVTVTIFNPGRVTARIYTLDGRLVSTLFDGDQPIGATTFTWDGRTGAGGAVASGVYALRIKGPKLDNVQKIVVIK